MKILYDVSCLDHDRISGVGTYARHLGEALLGSAENKVIGSYRLSRWRRLAFIRQHWPGPLEPYFPFLSDFTKGEMDIFHGPDFRIPMIRGVKRVVTVHDLAFYEPGMTDPKFAEKRIALMDEVLGRRRPDAVIAVSHFTRREVLKRFPKLDGRVYAVHHGADHLLRPANRGPRPMPDPYFLFVGNLEARKNVVGLIRAFDRFKDQSARSNVRLVLIGKPGFGFNEIKEAARFARHKDHIVLPGFIPNIGLVNYYQWAEAFVYPSLYEGFGFPVLEAMRLGCPVVTANISATNEVGEGCALLVNPLDDSEVAAAMGRMIDDSTLKEELVKKGIERGLGFTWKKCGSETLKVYKNALENV